MQTILGAGGAIGVELAKILPQYTDQVRLVSRNPKPVNSSDEIIKADLTNADDVNRAVKDSEIVYLIVGLQYQLKIWQQTWPVIMKNVIEACKSTQSKLVFFDNIYAYDGTNLNPITEDHPINPPSRKGIVRKEILKMFWNAIENKEIEGLVARAADFYGPSIKNVSVLIETVFNPLSEGKRANWLGKVDFKHSFTYTPDAARGTAILGNTPDAYGEVWHLPTAPDPLTGRQWIETVAEKLGSKPKFMAASKFVVKIIGLFNSQMKELVEMMYQYDRDYVFNSDKFNERFNFEPTSYLRGIDQIIETDYKK